MFNKSRLVLM